LLGMRLLLIIFFFERCNCFLCCCFDFVPVDCRFCEHTWWDCQQLLILNEQIKTDNGNLYS
jgi:hypothetical protein